MTMRAEHLTDELIPYINGELTGPERESVSDHLQGCDECRSSAEAFAGIFSQLQQSIPAPPPVDWGRYRSDLRRKLQQQTRRAAPWYRQPTWASAALGAAVAGLLLLTFVLRGGFEQQPAARLAPWQKAMIGTHLDLLENYPVVERLDLLENLDVIQNLDELSSEQQGASGA